VKIGELKEWHFPVLVVCALLVFVPVACIIMATLAWWADAAFGYFRWIMGS
jgi:hypothetical protein